jgi:hypothetical protein
MIVSLPTAAIGNRGFGTHTWNFRMIENFLIIYLIHWQYILCFHCFIICKVSERGFDTLILSKFKEQKSFYNLKFALLLLCFASAIIVRKA